MIMLISLLSCNQNPNWIQFRGAGGRGFTPQGISAPIGQKWKLQLQTDKENAFAFNNPVLQDGVLYFGSTDGNFYAFEIESGFMRWVFKAGGSINSVPTIDKKRVYFGANDGILYAVNIEDGSLDWYFESDSTIQSTVTLYKDLVGFSSDGGHTFFLDTETGEINFKILNRDWLYHTFTISDGKIYFAPGPEYMPHSFGVYDIPSQEFTWAMSTSELGYGWYSFPAVDGNLVHFSTCTADWEGFHLAYYAYDKNTGALVWNQEAPLETDPSVDLDEWFNENVKLLDYLTPVVIGGVVIYPNNDRVLRALDKNTGAIVWEKTLPGMASSSAVGSGDRVYVGVRASDDNPGSTDCLLCFRAADGALLWSIETDGAALSAPVIADRWMVFGTDRHVLYVLEGVF